MRCADCERIDNHIFDTTVFWLYLPTTESFGKLAAWCGSGGYSGEQFSSKGMKITLPRTKVQAFLTALYGEINGQELANTKILTTDGTDPRPEDIGRVMPGDVFVNRYQGRWIIDSLEAERYESHFQPIVYGRGDNYGTVFGHEALFRMRDDQGIIMPPAMVFDLAASSQLLFNLDLVARRTAVECASKARLPGKIFINFNPSSIYDPSYCLRTTAAAIESLGLKPSDIIFELTETHQAQDKGHLKGILAFYRNAGFGVALDDIGSGYSSLNMLHEMRPDYAKIDMDLIRGVDTDRFNQTIVTNLIQIAHKNGIGVVAEGIETEGEAAWMRSAGADLMQGYLFGKPEAPKAIAAE